MYIENGMKTIWQIYIDRSLISSKAETNRNEFALKYSVEIWHIWNVHKATISHSFDVRLRFRLLYNLNVRIDPDTGYQYQYPLWTKCSFTRYACNNFFFVRSFVQSPTFKWTDEIFISHPFGIVESGVLLSNINMHISLFIYFVFLLSFRGPVVLYVFANIQTGSNALHSRNRSDAIPMLSERYELRWPNKVSLIWKTEFWNWTPAIRGTMLRTTLQTIFNIPQIERQHEIPLQSDLT